MSAEAINLLLGVGKLYIKRTTDTDGKYRLVGSIKKNAKFTYKPTFVEQRPSDTIVMIRRDKVEETATMMVQITDWRADQLRYALGMSISKTTLSRTGSIRMAQELITKASTTTTQSISRTAKSMTSVAFTTLDRKTDFTRGTDFTMLTTKKFKAISAAFKGKVAVRAYFTKLVTGAQIIDVGDQVVAQNVSVMFVHQQSNGKQIAIIFPIATINGDLVATWAEKEYTTYEATFAALGDPAQPKGKKLYRIIKEP
jgi:hypothetical protein